MPILRFEGYSDDTFGEVAHFKDDYDNCASGKPIEYLVLGPAIDGQPQLGNFVQVDELGPQTSFDIWRKFDRDGHRSVLINSTSILPRLHDLGQTHLAASGVC